MDNLPKRRHKPEFVFLTQNPSAAVSAKLHCRSRISFLNSGARSQIFPIPTCLWRGSRRSRQEDPSVPLFLKRQSAAFPILKKKKDAGIFKSRFFRLSPTPARKIHLNIVWSHIPALHQEVFWEQTYACNNSKPLLMYKNNCKKLGVSTIPN